MPNISFDVFFDNDVLNFTATRSGGVPKVTPGWKVRTAPKLPPKPKPEDQVSKPNRPAKKPVAKPNIQPKSAPPVTKAPTQTIKVPSPKANGASKAADAKNFKVSQPTNGVQTSAPKATKA